MQDHWNHAFIGCVRNLAYPLELSIMTLFGHMIRSINYWLVYCYQRRGVKGAWKYKRCAWATHCVEPSVAAYSPCPLCSATIIVLIDTGKVDKIVASVHWRQFGVGLQRMGSLGSCACLSQHLSSLLIEVLTPFLVISYFCRGAIV